MKHHPPINTNTLKIGVELYVPSTLGVSIILSMAWVVRKSFGLPIYLCCKKFQIFYFYTMLENKFSSYMASTLVGCILSRTRKLIIHISVVKGITKKPLLEQLVRKIVQDHNEKEQLNQTQNRKITSIQKCQTITSPSA
jgi:hypothetical protein